MPDTRKLVSQETFGYYDGKLKEYIRSQDIIPTLGNYSNLPQNETRVGARYFVLDASGDSTVTSGSATYMWNGTSWRKISEQESLDLVIDYQDIQDVPDNLAAGDHTHGNISNSGAIGSTPNLPLITGTDGVITTGQFGNSAYNFVAGDDTRLSDEREPNPYASNKITSMEDYEVAEETSAISTSDSLNEAIGKLECKVLDWDDMTTEDVDMLFYVQTYEPNSVNFIGINPAEMQSIVITDSSGNQVQIPDLNNIILEEGDTYSIVIRRDNDVLGNFLVEYTPNGSNYLIIADPVLVHKITQAYTYNDDMVASNSDLFFQPRSTGARDLNVGSPLIFKSRRRMRWEVIDIYAGYGATFSNWHLYGSDNGKDWTLIGSAGSTITVEKRLDGFNGSHNQIGYGRYYINNLDQGWLFHKIECDSTMKSLYTFTLTEAYYVDGPQMPLYTIYFDLPDSTGLTYSLKDQNNAEVTVSDYSEMVVDAYNTYVLTITGKRNAFRYIITPELTQDIPAKGEPVLYSSFTTSNGQTTCPEGLTISSNIDAEKLFNRADGQTFDNGSWVQIDSVKKIKLVTLDISCTFNSRQPMSVYGSNDGEIWELIYRDSDWTTTLRSSLLGGKFPNNNNDYVIMSLGDSDPGYYHHKIVSEADKSGYQNTAIYSMFLTEAYWVDD